MGSNANMMVFCGTDYKIVISSLGFGGGYGCNVRVALERIIISRSLSPITHASQ